MSQPSSPLELRVLSGLHAGARVSLPAGDQAIRLGPTVDGDIVLRDLSVSTATLRVSDGQWHWQDADGELRLALGEALAVGELLLQVCAQSAPWPDSPAAVTVLTRPGAKADRGGPDPRDASLVETAKAQEDTPLTVQSLVMPALPDPTPPLRNRSRLATALIAAAVVLGIGLALLRWRDGSQDAQAPAETRQLAAISQGVDRTDAGLAPRPPGAGVNLPPVSSHDAREALERLIDEKSLHGQVVVREGANGRLEMAGVLADDDALEDLIRASRRMVPGVFSQLTTEADFRADILGLKEDLPAAIEIGVNPIGIVSLRGTVRDDNAREALIERVRQLSPYVVQIESELLTEAEAKAMEAMRLRERAQTGPNLPARSDASTGGATSVEGPTPELPRSRAVVGGPEPFLLLGTGERVFVGGMVEGLKLTAISDTEIEFQTADGKTYRSAR